MANTATKRLSTKTTRRPNNKNIGFPQSALDLDDLYELGIPAASIARIRATKKGGFAL